MAQITIVMPVYNSISRNGNGFIQQALDSLLKQTFEDFELHILDNISTDGTAELCSAYAKLDKRIKFEIDTEQRFPEGGINKLAYGITTKYMMVANCDDLWNHHYIERLHSILERHNDIAMAYSNGTYINEINLMGVQLLHHPVTFTYLFDWQQNFCLAVQFRSVVPLLFGLFRTEAYQSALPYKPFDELKANVDNVFLAKFFMNGHKAQIYNKVLFHYRDKNRSLIPNRVIGMPEDPMLIWVYYVQHQLNLYKTIVGHLPEKLASLKNNTLDSCMRHIVRLAEWASTLTKTPSDDRVLQEIKNMCDNIDKHLLTSSTPEITQETMGHTYKKCALLLEALEYCQRNKKNTLIVDTKQMVREIKNSIFI